MNLSQLVNPGTDVGSIANINPRFNNLLTYTPSMILRTVLNIMLGIAGVASFISLLFGGLQWILAGGDKEGTEKARKRITSALVGLAIVFSSYAILYVIRVLFNIDLIQFNIERLGS
jgi:hypothetical protein